MKKFFLFMYRFGFFFSITVIYVLAMVPTGQTERINHGDKLLHGLAFFVLTMLLSLSNFKKLTSVHIILILFFYGLFIEVSQLFTGYREFELADLAADLAGILLFAGGHFIFRLLFPGKSETEKLPG